MQYIDTGWPRSRYTVESMKFITADYMGTHTTNKPSLYTYFWATMCIVLGNNIVSKTKIVSETYIYIYILKHINLDWSITYHLKLTTIYFC